MAQNAELTYTDFDGIKLQRFTSFTDPNAMAAVADLFLPWGFPSKLVASSTQYTNVKPQEKKKKLAPHKGQSHLLRLSETNWIDFATVAAKIWWWLNTLTLLTITTMPLKKSWPMPEMNIGTELAEEKTSYDASDETIWFCNNRLSQDLEMMKTEVWFLR